MKNSIIKNSIFVLSAAAVLFTGCLKDDNDVFDKSATERINDAIENALTVLQGAPNGWRMEIYPDEQIAYGGYTAFAKFASDGTVTVASEVFQPTATATSYYSVSAESGPMLSFDTYNEIFHFFSSPETYQDYRYGYPQFGLKGDSDFIVLSAEPTHICLKGRKTGNYLHMYPAETSDWATELAAYADITERLMLSFTACEVDGTQYSVTLEDEYNNFSERTLYVDSLDIVMPYMHTKTGIKFYEPVEFGSHEVSEMTLVEDYYLSNEDGSVKILSPTPIRSDNQLTLNVSNITYNDALISITPTNSDWYYFDVMTNASNYSDRTIIRSLLSNINSYIGSYEPDFVLQRLGSQGTENGMLSDFFNASFFKPNTTYTLVAFGVSLAGDGKSIVSTTSLFKKDFTTADLPPLDPDYEKWLGTWRIVSTSSQLNDRPLTFDVTIDYRDPNVDYSVANFSILALREDYPVLAKWDSGHDYLVFPNMQEFEPTGEYMITYNCNYYTGTAYSIITGNFNALAGIMNSGSTSAGRIVGYNITLSGGRTVTTTGMDYYALGDGVYAQFTTAASGYTAKDYAVGPFTMTKTVDWVRPTAETKAAIASTNGGELKACGRAIRNSSENRQVEQTLYPCFRAEKVISEEIAE